MPFSYAFPPVPDAIVSDVPTYIINEWLKDLSTSNRHSRASHPPLFLPISNNSDPLSNEVY